MRRSTLYRPLLTLENDKLVIRHFTPLDLFNSNLRDEYLYRPLSLKHSIVLGWGSPFFSWTNTGLAIKNIYLQRKFNQALVNQETDPNFQRQRLAYNEKIIKDFLNQTLKQHASLIFFYGGELKDLPQSIQMILLQHSTHVTYINSSKLMKIFLDQAHLTPKEYLNSTNHYNVLGNRIYAAALELILKHDHWGAGERSFEFCSKTNRFQNITLNPCP